MIEGINRNLSESLYRDLLLDSSSSLKIFADSRYKYFKKFIEHVKTDDEDDNDNSSIIRGKLVETLLMEPKKFDEKFFLSSCAKSPTGLMLNFVNALYKHTVNCMTDDGKITRDFEALATDAYNDSGFKIKFDAVISKFSGSNAEIFYGEMLQVKLKGLTVVTTLDVTMAEKIVEHLKSSYVTKDIVNLIDSERFSVLTQYQIENFEIDGLPLKMMADKAIVDHVERTINIYDLKCTWSTEGFYDSYYLYRKAYIQAFVYYKGFLSLTLNPESEYYGYTINPTKFIVCDSGAFYEPLIYELTTDDLNDAYTGFEYKGRKYVGVYNIIQDLIFAYNTNVWNISRENYNNRGIVALKS